MVTFQQKILHVVKCFRRQWALFSNSERTTVCGADCMLMALQLSMAEVNKQVRILSVCYWYTSDLVPWLHLVLRHQLEMAFFGYFIAVC